MAVGPGRVRTCAMITVSRDSPPPSLIHFQALPLSPFWKLWQQGAVIFYSLLHLIDLILDSGPGPGSCFRWWRTPFGWGFLDNCQRLVSNFYYSHSPSTNEIGEKLLSSSIESVRQSVKSVSQSVSQLDMRNSTPTQTELTPLPLTVRGG